MGNPRRKGLTLGELLREKRDALGLTQEDMAARLGVSQASVSNIETSDDRLKVGRKIRVRDVADAYGVSVSRLLQPEFAA